MDSRMHDRIRAITGKLDDAIGESDWHEAASALNDLEDLAHYALLTAETEPCVPAGVMFSHTAAGGEFINPGDPAPCEDAREAFASLAHEQWSGWMKYLFSKCTVNEDGTATIPKWAVARWRRQLGTAYFNLSEQEKESDRQEADKMHMFATQVSDKRAEELRAQVERKSYTAIIKCKPVRAIDYSDIIEALAATEPKVCVLTRTESWLPNMENKGCWHDASSMETGNGKPIDFIPSRNGFYCKSCNADVDRVTSKGYCEKCSGEKATLFIPAGQELSIGNYLELYKSFISTDQGTDEKEDKNG